MRNKIIPLSSFLTIICVPLLTISCSTTWINWKRGDDIETNFEFKPNKEKAQKIKYEVRAKEQLMQAYDQDTNTLDLEQVNNHYELITILGQISNFKAKAPIDSFWKEASWKGNLYENGFFDFIKQDLTFKLKSKNNVSKAINYDLTTILNKIIQGFQAFSLTQEKAFDIEKDGFFTDEGIPGPIDKIAQLGRLMIKNDMVKSLTAYNSHFALILSKLVNIPKQSFVNFVDLLSELDKWTSEIFTSEEFVLWVKNKQIDFKVETDGHYFKNPLSNLKLFKAKFLHHILR